LGWFWFGSSRSSEYGSWYAVGVKPVCIILGLAIGGKPVSSICLTIGEMPVSSVGLATGGMPVSYVCFGYRWNAFERWSVWLQV
jgi:hypothetical protein